MAAGHDHGTGEITREKLGVLTISARSRVLAPALVCACPILLGSP